jgi:iron complex transport system substrate-binding protein
MRPILLFSLVIVLISCNSTEKNKHNEIVNDTIKNIYATGFRIIDHKNYKTVEVFNPWQMAKNISIQYNLVEKKDTFNSLDNCIKIPLKNVVCMSTTHIAFINALGETSTIKGISGADLVSNSIILKNLADHKVVDIGYEQSLNYELLIKLHPDAIFVYGIGSDVSGYVNKLKELNIPVILVGEYLETNPLAKVEWIKFFAEFFQKRKLADQIFDTISFQYNHLKSIAAKAEFKPKVMTGLPWNGTWYISGGKSYAAKLIADAGGNYIWNEIDSRESLPIDLETVFQKSDNADIWLNAGASLSKKDIRSIDERLVILHPFINNNIYNNNARLSNTGGNDYWESGTTHPQMILNDLIAIFHPELFPNYKLYYYQKLN